MQIINTIEIFFTINTKDEFVIEYNFHSYDFDLWKEIVKIHLEGNDDAILKEDNNVISLDELQNNSDYYSLKLVSKNFNLYRNINLIFCLNENEESKRLKMNTWSNQGL